MKDQHELLMNQAARYKSA